MTILWSTPRSFGTRITLVFSIEMTRSQWEQQTVATHARVTTGRMRNPEFLNVVERQKLRDAVENIRNRPLFIDDSSPLHIRELLARARQFIRKKKCNSSSWTICRPSMLLVGKNGACLERFCCSTRLGKE